MTNYYHSINIPRQQRWRQGRNAGGLMLSNKQSLPDRDLDLPIFFHYKHITSLKNHISCAQGQSLSYWSRGNFCDCVCFDLPGERISLVCSPNHFELICQLKKLLLMCYKICPSCINIKKQIYRKTSKLKHIFSSNFFSLP